MSTKATRSWYSAAWYPWLVALLCMFLVATSNGLINAGITVFDESLLEEFGWTLTELKTRDSITFLGASVLVLVAGWGVDRFGFKPLLLIGMATLAFAYYRYSAVTSLTGVYLLHGLFAFVAASGGNMTNLVAAATWMPRRRGLAVGMAIAGTSVGGMFLPPLASYLNQIFGWRQALQIEALLPVIMFVLVLMLLGNRHRNSAPLPGAVNERQHGATFGEALRRPEFYLIAGAGAFTYFAVLALFSHLFLYMRSINYAPQTASYALSALAIAALCGKLLSGVFSDRINPFRLFKALMLLMLLGLAGIGQLPGAIWVFLLITGLGWGGLHTLYNFILIYLFGLRDAGKINGAVSIFEAAGGSAGIYAVSVFHDHFGGYPAAWLMVLGIMALGTCLVLPLRSVPAHDRPAA